MNTIYHDEKLNMRKKIIIKILHKLGFGFCVYCKKLTREMGRFADDVDDYGYPEYGYLDYCHEECYEILLEKL